MRLPKMTEMAHCLMRQAVQDGDIAVDATCGNGNDTLFLAERVGDRGRVFAFDIQEQALENTRRLLREKGLLHRAVLIRDSHERIPERVPERPVKGIMFNLGYLPGGVKEITTRAASTRIAVERGLDLLAPGGLMTICVYTGHPEGKEESRHLLEWSRTLDEGRFQVVRYDLLNLKNDPPYLLAVFRRETP